MHTAEIRPDRDYTWILVVMMLIALTVGSLPIIPIIVDDPLLGNQAQLTPQAGNCGCGYPDCGCVQLTLMPTVQLTALATFQSLTPPVLSPPTVIATITLVPAVDLPTTVAGNSIPTVVTAPTLPPTYTPIVTAQPEPTAIP